MAYAEIRPLTGTAAEWEAHDIVPGRGEIAVMDYENGLFGLKQGDGRNKFSELPWVYNAVALNELYTAMQDLAKAVSAAANEAADSAAGAASSAAEAAESESAAQEYREETSGMLDIVRQKANEFSSSVDAAKQDIADTGAVQINAVAAAGQEQMTAVNNAGTAQKSAVEAAGAEQVDAVYAAGAAALETIGTGIDATLTHEDKAADAKAVGDAVSELKGDLSNFGVAKVNPNNIFGNQSILNSVQLLPSEKTFYISGDSVITLDDGIAKYIQLQSGEYIYCIIPLESIVSGSYIAKIKRVGASKYLGRFLFTFGILQGNAFGQLGGGKMMDASDEAEPEWEFELNIEKTKEDYPTATHIRFGFSNSSNTSAYFGYPFIGAQENDNNFLVYNELLNGYHGYSKLYKKSISVEGDSISRGAGNGNVGYAEIIGNMLNMTVYNQAVSGGTLATETKFSDGTNRHWISESIKSMHDADYIIVSGGFNDYGNNVDIGQLTLNLSGNYSQTCDTTTILGAIEQICRDLIAMFPERKIGFVFTHKIGSTWRVANTEGHTMKQIHDSIVDCLERYSIPYCDLFTKAQFPTEITSLKQYTDNGEGVNDGIHPNQKGYELFYVPKIVSWLESL